MVPEIETLRSMLQNVRKIAIVGAKDEPGQAVDRVGRYLINAGYEIFPVHPVRANVWGLPTYKSIGDLPEPVDLVDLFRAEEFCTGHAREVLALVERPKVFWMQLGIRSPEAAAMLQKEGITVIEDACLMVEHRHAFVGKPDPGTPVGTGESQ